MAVYVSNKTAKIKRFGGERSWFVRLKKNMSVLRCDLIVSVPDSKNVSYSLISFLTALLIILT